jgi:ABC-type Fe2+-enterobactin transport system substrate-binding protein
MRTEKSQFSENQAVEGEYMGKAEDTANSIRAFDEFIQDATRYVRKNPKKTAVIVVATTAAAMAAAITAAVSAAALLYVGGLKKRWFKSQG